MKALISEFERIDSDLRHTSPWVLLVITCLALLFAASVAFGGIHL